MYYSQEIEHVLASTIGDDGVSEASLGKHYETLKSGIAQLAEWKDSRHLPMLSLPTDTDDLDEVEEVGAWFRNNFANVLVVGTGGSSLGGQTLAALKENPYKAGVKGAPRIWFLDNVDPHTMDTLLASIDLAETGCLVISKSGGTAEIIAQTLVLFDVMAKKLGDAAIGKHCISITEPQDNPLRRLSEKYGIRILEHDPKVGGRFSVLSRVGLIPAAIAGLNVRELRKGAASVLQQVLDAGQDPQKAAPAVGAALHYDLMQKGRNIAVLMPYCDRLAYFGMWFRQLWAESLGKDGKGSTPVRALGTVDQHSQLQLYLDGPKDKFFTLIHPRMANQGPRIDGKMVAEEKLAYIRDQKIGDVMAAYQQGTSRSLMKNNCPLRHVFVDVVNEASLGALLMHFMLETILTAHLMGINAFDQPAVEDSKIFAREYLSENPAKVA
jgi:glucose-6-phosphate isomerase